MEPMIRIHNLKKTYGKTEAVKGIEFYVEKGTLFSFLGTNGAGKSTTIDILCTLLKPDSGTVVIDGHLLGKEDQEIRAGIGVVFQDSVLDPLLTVKENLYCRASSYHLSGKQLSAAVEQAALAADITEFLNRPYGTLSGGQRRRADIARALVNMPKLLFLDEPTTGLDPKTKESVWSTIIKLQKETGMTLFLTTHYMEEAATSDYIVMIDHGKIAAKGTPYALKAAYSSDTLRMKPANREQLVLLLLQHGYSYEERNGIFISRLAQTKDSIPFLQHAAPYLENFEVLHGSMNDVFLTITGGELPHA